MRTSHLLKFFLLSSFVFIIGCDQKKDEKKSTSSVSSAHASPPAVESLKNKENLPLEEKKEEASNLTNLPSENKSLNESSEKTKDVAAILKDGSVITEIEIMERMKDLPQEVVKKINFEQLRNMVLFVILREKLGYEKAKEAGFDKNEEIIKKIAKVRKHLTRGLFLESKMKLKTTDSDLEKKYNEIYKKYKPEQEIQVKIINFKTEKEAEAALKELKPLVLAAEKFKEKFFEIWKKQNSDKAEKFNANDCGLIPTYFNESSVPQSLSKDFSSITVGSLFPEIIFIDGLGHCIFVVHDKKMSTPKKFEEVKPQVEKIVLQENVIQYIENLREESKAIMYDPNGKVVPFKKNEERIKEFVESQKNPNKKPTKEDVERDNSLASLKPDSVVCEVRGMKFKKKDIVAIVEEKPKVFSGLSPWEVYSEAISELVFDYLISEEIKKDNFEANEACFKKLEFSEKTLISQEFILEKSNELITEADLHAKYDEMKNSINKDEMELKLRLIILETKEEADKILKEVKAKGFDACQKEKLDRGYILKSKLKQESPEIFKAVENMKGSTVCNEVITAGGMYFVIKLDDRRLVKIPTFSEIKENIRNILMPDKSLQFSVLMIIEMEAKVFDGRHNQIKNDVTSLLKFFEPSSI